MEMRVFCARLAFLLFVYDLLQLQALFLLIYFYLTLAQACVCGGGCLLDGKGGVRSGKLLHGMSVYSLPRALTIGCLCH